LIVGAGRVRRVEQIEGFQAIPASADSFSGLTLAVASKGAEQRFFLGSDGYGADGDDGRGDGAGGAVDHADEATPIIRVVLC